MFSHALRKTGSRRGFLGESQARPAGILWAVPFSPRPSHAFLQTIHPSTPSPPDRPPESIAGKPPGRVGSFRATAEEQRALAMSHMQAGRHAEAERVMTKALASLPTYANFWNQLAVALQMQGRTDEAVSALVAAQFWSDDPAAVALGYERLAQNPAFGGQRYRAAGDAIAAVAASRHAFEATLPSLSASAPVYTRAVIE